MCLSSFECSCCIVPRKCHLSNPLLSGRITPPKKNDRTVFDQIDGYFPRIVDEKLQPRVMFMIQNMTMGTAISNATSATATKHITHCIVTGVVWSHGQASSGHCVCCRSTDGTYAYADKLTRHFPRKPAPKLSLPSLTLYRLRVPIAPATRPWRDPAPAALYAHAPASPVYSGLESRLRAMPRLHCAAPWLRGLIRPVPAVCANAQGGQRETTIDQRAKAGLLEFKTPEGLCWVCRTGQSAHASRRFILSSSVKLIAVFFSIA